MAESDLGPGAIPEEGKHLILYAYLKPNKIDCFLPGPHAFMPPLQISFIVTLTSVYM